MTLEEHLEQLETAIESKPDGWHNEEAYRMANVLRRDVAKKPYIVLDEIKCGACGNTIGHNQTRKCINFCDQCGRRINWKEIDI